MKTYKGIIFDLDGTLLDTIEDLRDSVNDVMKIYGWKEHDTKACKQMVGNGFRKLITRALPEDKQKNELALDSTKIKSEDIRSAVEMNKKNNTKELKLQLIPINEEIIPVLW